MSSFFLVSHYFPFSNYILTYSGNQSGFVDLGSKARNLPGTEREELRSAWIHGCWNSPCSHWWSKRPRNLGMFMYIPFLSFFSNWFVVKFFKPFSV